MKTFIIDETTLAKLGSFLGKCPYSMKKEIDEVVKLFSDLKQVEVKAPEAPPSE